MRSCGKERHSITGEVGQNDEKGGGEDKEEDEDKEDEKDENEDEETEGEERAPVAGGRIRREVSGS